MFKRLNSLGVFGLDGYVVSTEVDISGGLPQFAIVGLPDNAIKEATDRVRSAIKNLGFTYPASRITVNLAPADLRKTGSVYDLPVLLGLLAASGQLQEPKQDTAFIGEVSLDGQIRPVKGVLPMALACKTNKIRTLFLPYENRWEGAVVEGLTIYAAKNVSEVVQHLNGKQQLEAHPSAKLDFSLDKQNLPDFADVRGQYEARRAMEIAAVGQHNILLVGSPGTGKSMLAKRLPGILPPLEYQEAIETSKVYSVAGMAAQAEFSHGILTSRPFRSPHHSVSSAGLAGGGAHPRPGEISLAHNGVLFLDELPEFSRDALEVLRQPMEDGSVTVSRVAASAVFPCEFMLVAAMNPCACGYFGHPVKECRCHSGTQEKYLQKVSGPLLDRIDLHIEVQPVEYEQLSSGKEGESSAEIYARVLCAKSFQQQTREKQKVYNARLSGKQLREYCKLDEQASDTMKNAFERMGLSARGYDRVLRVCRTIADLDTSETIKAQHVQEAVQYRNLDRKYWHSR